ncbi:MAG: hypothetical protein RMJ14_01845 [Nitrososphaerota archaeon]|nr:hypothetical protein [Aigarchaeota archaeon]MDW8076366.1 hypothetical protein [Nitrososphaerota archaeon]
MRAIEFRCEACDQVLDLKEVYDGCYLIRCNVCGRMWVLTVVELEPEEDGHG